MYNNNIKNNTLQQKILFYYSCFKLFLILEHFYPYKVTKSSFSLIAFLK